MEGYITKLEGRLTKKYPIERVKKIKRNYRIIGGCVLGAGLVGLFVMFGLYLYNFINAETKAAFNAWLYAIPFVLLIVAGAVLCRVGDRLLKEETPVSEKVDKEEIKDKNKEKKNKK